MPGFEAMQAQQKAFLQAMTSGMPGWPKAEEPKPEGSEASSDDLADIKKQLAELQAKLGRL